jgi:hypothetical protein
VGGSITKPGYKNKGITIWCVLVRQFVYFQVWFRKQVITCISYNKDIYNFLHYTSKNVVYVTMIAFYLFVSLHHNLLGISIVSSKHMESLWGAESRTFGSFLLIGSYRRAIVGSTPHISWTTYFPISCSCVVRVLVCHPSGPGLIYGMSRSESAITRGNLINAAATYLVFVNILMFMNI